MAGSRRPSFSDTVEIVQFVADGAKGEVQYVEISGARREPSPIPAKMVPCSRASGRPVRASSSRTAAWGGSWSASSSPDSGSSSGTLATTSDDSDAEEEVFEESVLAKTAQRRRIRRSVTANLGSGLSLHTLPSMAMSRLLSRRQGFLKAESLA
ncbi:unnamed protein product [Prorocentrum cordatum]|uniref:Uncharacterized protein n=1 Tax=Prorocentrum cordatum TaxID=2364126 RepID=A0ABN9TMD8_9DINO|nr:unnamed protein product [Polarella glacialis]